MKQQKLLTNKSAFHLILSNSTDHFHSSSAPSISVVYLLIITFHHQTNTCSRLTTDLPEQGAKYVQS